MLFATPDQICYIGLQSFFTLSCSTASTRERPGEVYRVLSLFAAHHRSQPITGRPGESAVRLL